MTEEQGETGSGGIREGVRQGWGFLAAFKDAIEETLAESRERGELSPERASEVLRGALGRAQEAAGEARERLDFATRREMDELRAELAGLRARLDALDGGAVPGQAGAGPGDVAEAAEHPGSQGVVPPHREGGGRSAGEGP